MESSAIFFSGATALPTRSRSSCVSPPERARRRGWSVRSALLLHERLVVFLGDLLVRDPDDVVLGAWVGLVFGREIGPLDRALALADGVLVHAHVQLTLVHGVERVRTAVGSADVDLAQFAGCLDGHERAERHLVVVGGDSVDLVAGGEPVLHDGPALRALPVAGLLADDLDARVLREDLLRALGPLDGGLVL